MVKQRISPSADFPSIEAVNNTLSQATGQPMRETFTERKAQKVTKKNTMVANAMFETELFTMAKIKAATERTTFSAIVNDALREYLNK